MTERQPFKLHQLGTVARGKSRHRPRNDPALYGGKWPFFQTGDVKEADLYLRYYTQTYNDIGLAQSKLWPVGTLCITIAANIAETAILGVPGCFPDSIVGFIPDPKKSDAHFIKYFIETLKIGMQNASKGTTQDNLSVDKLMTFDFVVPRVEEQRRIASILSAYDDLIENNTRRIAILEEMARRIYEEWFVRFRFPGHENMRMVESELGPVPRGWTITSFADICSDVVRGVTPKYEVGSGRFVLNQKSNRGSELVEAEFKELSQACTVPREKFARFGDVLVNSLGEGTIGRVHFYSSSQREVAVDQHMTICRADSFGRSRLIYQYLASLEGQERIQSVKTGATSMTMLNISALRAFTIPSPPKDLIDEFWAKCEPLIRLVAVLRSKNTNLRTARDLLLPKLISGELDVSAMPEPETAAA